MTPRFAACAAVALCALTSPAHAQTDDGTFRVSPLVGSSVEGPLQAISPSGEIAMRGGPTLELQNVVDIVRKERADATNTDHKQFAWLRSGSEFACTLTRGGEDQLELATQHGEDPITIALAHVAAIRFTPALDEDAGFARAIENPSATKDLLFAWDQSGENLKRYSMRVTAVRGQDLVVEVGGRERTLPIQRVHGVIFGTDNGAAPDALPRPIATVHGSFGTPLAGTLRSWDGLHCRLAIAEGAELEIRCATIQRIAIDTGRVAFLSDLEPSKVRQIPALNQIKPWLRNRTPVGEGFELAGRHFDRGLCLVPRTTLTFALTGDYDVFEATIGIDDRAHRLAHAVLRIVADKKIVFDSGPMAYGDAPKPVSIDLAGVRELVLETDFGENLDLGDHCAFADARFRKN